jgi:hypothetical protein
MADLGEIARAVGEEYLRTRRTTPFQRKALRSIQRCRTPALGAVRAECENCGAEHLLFRSCRNRHCPRCQNSARAEWLAERQQEILPVPYFHVVFTVPQMLNDIALYCPEVFYAALLRSAGNAVLDVGLTKLRARLGCLTVLHTWGQNLSLHPHVHCVVPGGGFTPDRSGWVTLRNPSYLLPVKVLSRRFRTLLCTALREALRTGKLERLPKDVLPHVTIEGAAAQEWIAYVKPPFGGPQYVLEYLSRYTHRVAISNSRIILFADRKVTFRWRDYADSNRPKLSSVTALEFLRRFLMHVLPDRFVKIRYFGFMTNQGRRRNIERARTLIGLAPPVQFCRRKPPVLCPVCYAAPRQSDQLVVQPTPNVRPPPSRHHVYDRS